MSRNSRDRFYAAEDGSARISSTASLPSLGPGNTSTTPRTPSPLRSQRRSTSAASNAPAQPVTTAKQPLKRQRLSTWWTKNAQDRWTGELLAGALCIALLGTVAGILIGYNGESAPSLPNGVTINALIAVLSTLAKGSLLVVLAAAIRQECWLYMSKSPKALDSVDTFDGASQGPWGAIVMLANAKGSGRALLLASVTVLSFGFEAFLQQLLVLETQNVAAPDLGTASLLTPTSYEAFLARVGNNTGGSELVLAASIGAYGGASGAVPLPFCPSGNCTWPDYNTLAMCTACEDVTSRVDIEGTAFSDNTNFNEVINDYLRNANTSSSSSGNFNATFRMPTGNSPSIEFPYTLLGADPVTWSLTRPRRYVWSLNIDPTPDSHWASNWQNDTIADIPAPLFAMGYLDMDLDATHSRLTLNRALSCALTPCVRTQHTAMQSWVLHPNTTHTDYGRIEIDSSQPDGTVTSGFRARVNGTDFELVDNGTGNIDGSANDFVRSLRIVLEGNSTYMRQGVFYGGGEEDGSFDYEATAFTQTSSPWSSIGQQAIDGAGGDFEGVLEQVARAVSGKMQELREGERVLGTVLRAEVVVRVRWAWLAFPLGLVLAGLGGLLGTVLATRRGGLPIWKDSVLPLVLRGKGAVDEVGGRGARNPASEIAREAEQEQVHLVRVRDGPAESSPLWLFESSSPRTGKELQSLSTPEDVGVVR